MKNLTFNVILISFLISLGIFFVISYFSFLSYQTSMTRVLNIEKGIIGEFLPYKISTAMTNHESKQTIQSMIDSNKKVFNIVITDCPLLSDDCGNQKILYTQNNFNDTTLLKGETWFPLRNPPPLYNEKLLKSYKSGSFADKQTTNEGEVIGRVYVLERQDMKQRTLLNTLAFRMTKWIERLQTGKFSNDAYMYDKNAGLSLLLFFILCSIGWLQNKRMNEKLESTKSIAQLKSENEHLIEEKSTLSSDINNLRDFKDKQQLELSEISNARKVLLNKLQELAEKFQALEQNKKNQEFELVKIKEETSKLIKEQKVLVDKYAFISNYAMANKFLLESEFTAPINNELQKLNLIIEALAQRLHFDTKDALHDINKAPLLRDENLTNEHDLTKLYVGLVDSRNTINWTTDNIRHLTNLGISTFDIYEEIKDFYSKLPPAANLKDIEITLSRVGSEPLIIEANPFHIRAIVKNALYNSTYALNKLKRKMRRSVEAFKGKIVIECGNYDDNYVYIKIIDNAGGVPEEFMEKLYDSSQKVNPDSDKLSGNGSLIVTSYLLMYRAKVLKKNIENGFEVIFLFKKTKKA